MPRDVRDVAVFIVVILDEPLDSHPWSTARSYTACTYIVKPGDLGLCVRGRATPSAVSRGRCGPALARTEQPMLGEEEVR